MGDVAGAAVTSPTPTPLIPCMRPTTWDDALHQYATAMSAAGRAPGTIRLHLHYLTGLAARTGDPWSVTLPMLREVLGRPDWMPETRKSCRAALRGFYRWGHGLGLVDIDPAERLDSVRVPVGVARPAPEAVVRATLAGCGRRVGLMVRLASYGALRAAEIAGLHTADLVGDVLRVRGKGGKVREVPLTPDLRDRMRGLEAGWVFPNGRGGHLTPGHVTRLVSDELPAGWTCHTLRHRWATQAYAGTRDLLAVGAVLGHSRPETTQRYVRMPDDALRAAVVAASVLGAHDRTTAASAA